MKKFEQSELLKLFAERFEEWDGKPYQFPQYSPASLERLENAVRCQIQLESSDPFAGPRLRLYLTRGYEEPGEMLKECHARLAAQRRQRSSVFEAAPALQGLKRRLDEDKAWAQHRKDARFMS